MQPPPIWKTAHSATLESGATKRVHRASRIAVIASHGGADVSRSLAAMCDALEGAGFVTIVVRTGHRLSNLRWPETSSSPIVLRRANLGYDFGSWAVAMERFPRVRTAKQVLLLNDSMVGPFGPLDAVLESFESSMTDVWGLTSTEQFIPHLQSYFLGFRGGVLDEPAIRKFWRRVRHQSDKMEIIQRYELGLSKLFFSEAIPYSAFVPSEVLVHSGANPTIQGWKGLLELGVPLVKRQLVRHPELAPNGQEVPDEVARRYGEEVTAWL